LARTATDEAEPTTSEVSLIFSIIMPSSGACNIESLNLFVIESISDFFDFDLPL